MAKISSTSGMTLEKPKKRRPGIHSKKKQSSHKHGVNYKKAYKGQGK